VPVGTSPEPGIWRSKPYQREVLDACTDSSVRGVAFIACSQGGGKTETLINAVGYYVDHDPSPILLVEPTVEMAEALSKDRLVPMIRASGLPISDSRESGNTIRHKVFPGGHLTLVGANSAAGLSMRPIRVLLLDEIDRFPASAGTEGDPISLAEARTSAFWNARKVVATSPGFKGDPDGKGGSRSWSFWYMTDRCEFYVPCPSCSHEQFLEWSHVHWEKDEATGAHRPETATYVCAACGEAWEDRQRYAAIRRGAYRATNPGSETGWRGFRLPAMAVLGRALEPMVRQWLQAQGHPEQLKAFKNTVLAEWYEEHYHALDETGLLSRREVQIEVGGVPEVPAVCAVVTAGVDVQEAPARVEISSWAWATGEESWLLEHEVILGDPAGPALWLALEAYLRRPWPRAVGGLDYTRGICIDTGGHHTQAAYDYCRPRFRLLTPDQGSAFTFAIKGRAGPGEIWPRHPSRAIKHLPMWPILVDPAKEMLYGRLGLASPGPGYVHLPTTVDERYCKGLVGEKAEDVVDKKGRSRRAWRPKSAGVRLEPLDCAVYAYAALCGLRAMGFDLELEAAKLPMRPVFTPQAGVVPSASAPPAAPAGPARPAYREPKRQWIEPRRDWLRR